MSTINLLPEDYIERITRRRANFLCLILFGITMAAVVGAVFVSERSSRRIEQVRGQTDQSYADAARLIRRVQELDVKRQSMLTKAQSISKLMENVPRSYLLAVITNALPEHTSLTSVSLSSERIIALPQPAGSSSGKFDRVSQQRAATTSLRVKVAIIGLAGTDIEVAKFMTRLARCPLAESVDLAYSIEKTEAGLPVREFKVLMELEPNAEVPRTAALMAPAVLAARSLEPSVSTEDTP